MRMRMQVILDFSSARLGSDPIWGGKKGEFRDWTYESFPSFKGCWKRNYALKNLTQLGFFQVMKESLRWRIDREEERDCFLPCFFPLFTGRDGRDGRKGFAGARGFPGPKGMKHF